MNATMSYICLLTNYNVLEAGFLFRNDLVYYASVIVAKYYSKCIPIKWCNKNMLNFYSCRLGVEADPTIKTIIIEFLLFCRLAEGSSSIIICYNNEKMNSGDGVFETVLKVDRCYKKT